MLQTPAKRGPATPVAQPFGRQPDDVVLIVDDDLSMRQALSSLVEIYGWSARTFGSAEAFLACAPPSGAHCLVLDIGLPSLDGLALQERIAGERAAMPIIFLTGQADVPKTIRAMKGGAAELLEKPVAEDDLLTAIRAALARSRQVLQDGAELDVLRERYTALSRRERQVMDLVVRGELNKTVGAILGITEITVKAHRGRMMDKMKAGSLAELVRMSARLGVQDPRESA
jgi:FixJ family two-component response regulator